MGKSLSTEIEKLEAEVLSCIKCALYVSRTKAVFSRGTSFNPEVLFIGEAPGYEEDKQGKPFVGRSGKLLDGWIEYLGFDSYVITNVVKCRPPENRTPAREEIETCRPYLLRQLAIYKPKLIVLLGRVAVDSILGLRNQRMGSILGRCFETEYGRATVLYHPSYCLRYNVDVKQYLDSVKELAAEKP